MFIHQAPPQAQLLLSLIARSSPDAGLIEIRYCGRTFGEWRQQFWPIHGAIRPPNAASHDVYVGCMPRLRPSGRRDAMASGTVLWADCDGNESVAALDEFPVAPSLVVASGSRGHRHAYWLLSDPLPPQVIERSNRRLALTLGSDPAVAHANAIMRLPGTFNHKSDPARPVEVIAHRPVALELSALLRECPGLPRQREHRPVRPVGTSPLAVVPPDEYVRVILGVEVPPSRKVRCPGPHEDRTPSLHVYPTVERGWFCFGCRRGGTLYDLAGLVLGLPPRGESFVEIDRRLRELWRCDSD